MAPVLSAVTIAGEPVVGGTLAATAITLPSDLPVEYAWARCSASGCVAVGSGSTHAVTDADVASEMEVTATVTDADGTSSLVARSGVVQQPPPPEPTPTPTPEPTATATPPPPPPPPPPAPPPVITAVTEISGTPLLGEKLTSSAGSWTPTGAAASYRWQRCKPAPSIVCENTDVRGKSYTVVDGDAGSEMRVRLRVDANGLRDEEFSARTAVVKAPPPPPSEPPSPPASSPPAAAPGESGPRGTPFTFTGTTPDPKPTTTTIEVAGETRSLRVLKYFPVVRIRGFLTSGGAMVQVLSIRAPKNVRINVRCIGRGCPRRSWARTVALVRARAFEGRLPAGVKLVIAVRRKGAWIGKYTSIRIHRGKAPTRTDRCLYPGRAKPRACPRPS